MYSFEPSDEQKMLIDAVARYAKSDLRPAGHDADEEKKLPQKLIGKGWELGVLQASIPEAYGGFGERSAVTGVLAAEELAFGDLAGALAVMTPAQFVLPVLLAGSEEQKQTWETGVLFHMIGALSEYGKLGVTVIGNSRDEVAALYAQVLRVLDDETTYE